METHVAPSAPPSRSRSETGLGARAPLLLSLLSVVITAFLFVQTRRDLANLGAAQQQLATQVSALQKPVTIDVSGSPALGPAEAAVTLVEFSDYECPFCSRHFTQTMPRLVDSYIRPGKIRYVFRDMPIDQLHPAAIRAHQAARCAEQQKRFWEMHNVMFSAPGTHTDEALEAKASQVGLDVASFRACLASGSTVAEIRQSSALGMTLGAEGTPTFFLGLRDLRTNEVRIAQTIVGAQPFDVFQRAIDAAIAQNN